MFDRITLTEYETSLLLNISNGRRVPLSFETNKVWLKGDQIACWAISTVKEWRGQLVNDGGGI